MPEIPDPTNLLAHQHPSEVMYVSENMHTVAHADWRDGVWFTLHWDGTRQYAANHEVSFVARLETACTSDEMDDGHELEDLERVWDDLPAKTQEALEE